LFDSGAYPGLVVVARCGIERPITDLQSIADRANNFLAVFYLEDA
jgi:hypothetical protein